ncbi:MAG: Ni/Fe hydrogenase subunit alpha [Patescibacteria group bacterium]|jgi:coenzyme F420-reducing hydrogenase alpha subunit
MKIKISHLAKIEGHASFFADMLAGDIKNAKLKIVIGARLIESIILNRNYIETPIVTSRICGICSVAHNITSIKAIENALGVKINPQIERLRKVLVLAEPIQSHAAHLFFLSLSDFFKYESDVDLIKKYPDLAKKIILIRDFGNKIKDVVGGRDMHMIVTEIGGFRRVLDDKIIQKLIDETEPVLEAAIGVAKFFRALDYPKYERKVEFAGLVAPREYAFYDGVIGSTVESTRPVKKFYNELSEKQTKDDPTKRASHLGKSFMPGAIARLNLSHRYLNPEAKKFLSFFPKPNGKVLTHNTFHNIYAQSVELVHCVEEVRKLLKEYLRDKSRNLMVKYTLKNGEGLGATEAPRGTLYHYYKIDKYGIIRACNIITPTAQFLDNLENDLEKYLNEANIKDDRDRKWKINMMVRAYDPCMTCATH